MKLIRQIFSAAAIGLAAFIFTECKSETPQMSPKLDEETLLKKLPFLTPDEVMEVMARKQAEMAETVKMMQEV